MTPSNKLAKNDWKNIGIDIAVDIVAGALLALGLYNFAYYASFPVAGFSGLAIVLKHLTDIPIGIGTILLNIIPAIFSYRYVGRNFFLRSLKTIIITSIIIDYVAPLIPVFTGNKMLAAICVGVLCGIGFGIIFLRGSSSGGQDFLSVPINKMFPRFSMGTILFVLDLITLVIGTALVFKSTERMIYGIIVVFIMSKVIDWTIGLKEAR